MCYCLRHARTSYVLLALSKIVGSWGYHRGFPNREDAMLRSSGKGTRCLKETDGISSLRSYLTENICIHVWKLDILCVWPTTVKTYQYWKHPGGQMEM